MAFLRPPSTHRDLLRLLVTLAIVQSLVQVISAGRPPPHRHRGSGGRHRHTREIAPDRPLPGPLPVAVPRDPTGQPPAGAAAAPDRRTRRGRRAPSARRRGSRGQRWSGNQPTGLLIGHLNIQSLKPKVLELSAELDKFEYDLFCLSETWLRPDTPSDYWLRPATSCCGLTGRTAGVTAVLQCSPGTGCV